MADADGNYYVIEDVKLELDIADTDEADDNLLNGYGLKANAQIDNDVITLVGAIPALDANITEDLKMAAVYYVSRRYKIFKREFEAGTEYKKLYEETIKGIENKAKQQMTTKTKRVSVTKAYRSEPQLSNS